MLVKFERFDENYERLGSPMLRDVPKEQIKEVSNEVKMEHNRRFNAPFPYSILRRDIYEKRCEYVTASEPNWMDRLTFWFASRKFKNEQKNDERRKEEVERKMAQFGEGSA